MKFLDIKKEIYIFGHIRELWCKNYYNTINPLKVINSPWFYFGV